VVYPRSFYLSNLDIPDANYYDAALHHSSQVVK
jgi:hypothetical protein